MAKKKRRVRKVGRSKSNPVSGAAKPPFGKPGKAVGKTGTKRTQIKKPMKLYPKLAIALGFGAFIMLSVSMAALKGTALIKDLTSGEFWTWVLIIGGAGALIAFTLSLIFIKQDAS